MRGRGKRKRRRGWEEDTKLFSKRVEEKERGEDEKMGGRGGEGG